MGSLLGLLLNIEGYYFPLQAYSNLSPSFFTERAWKKSLGPW